MQPERTALHRRLRPRSERSAPKLTGIWSLFDFSEKRLARFAPDGQFRKGWRTADIVTKLSQATLAELIGTTRSRVSFFMNKFRKLGFIEYNGDPLIHNSSLNAVLHGDPEIRRDKLGAGGEEQG